MHVARDNVNNTGSHDVRTLMVGEGLQSAWEVYRDKVGEIGMGTGGLTAEVVGVNTGGCLPHEPTSSHLQ